LVTAVRFSNCQEALSLTTAAQNMCNLCRKSPLCRNHFFGWSKTANSSTACGTVTLKSPPSRGSDALHVHQRPRKRLARCTLDCGLKTSESPALRGFVAERCPIRGTSLYLVLKSNGLRHSKNLPVKFGFSPRTVPANIAKKLPAQRCSKPFFNFSHKRPSFAFTGESGYTLGFRKRIAHKGTHGETRGVLGGGGITTLGAFHTVRKPCAAGCQNGILCRFWVLTGCAHKEHREPLGQRCAHARRCSEGVAAPLGCVIFLLLSKLRPVRPIPDTSFGFPDAPACAVPVQTLSQLVPFRLGAVQGFSVLSLRLTSFFENGDQKGRHLFAHCDQSTSDFRYSVFVFSSANCKCTIS